MTTRINHVAVYGTLRAGQAAARKMVGCKQVDTVRLPGTMYNMGWFPGIRLDTTVPDDTFVAEVYQLPDEASDILAALDAYEGYDPDDPEHSLYIRKALSYNGLMTYIYEINRQPNPLTRIHGGDWSKKHVESR